MSRSDWELIRRIYGGHSYWRRKADGAIGIADDSGTYPEDCEPAGRPPLLLDQSRPVDADGHRFLIPVQHEPHGRSFTVGSAFEALWVATTFGMGLEATEHAGAAPRWYTVIAGSGGAAARSAVRLDYVGAVDQGDVGRAAFRLSELGLVDGKDHELELSVEPVTENANGTPAARVALSRIKRG